MKNLLIPIIASMLLFGLSTTVSAQTGMAKTPAKTTVGPNFVDANNDGICDNRPSGKQGVRGRNFVDANNDGICDNRGSRNRGNGNGYRNGNGKGNGNCNGNANGCRRGRGNR